MHQSRAFSGANLEKLESVRRNKLLAMETYLNHRIVRRVGRPPPPGPKDVTLKHVHDILYTRHLVPQPHFLKRKLGEAGHIADNLALANFANDNLNSDAARRGVIVHHCHDEKTNAPCCRDEAAQLCFHSPVRSLACDYGVVGGSCGLGERVVYVSCVCKACHVYLTPLGCVGDCSGDCVDVCMNELDCIRLPHMCACVLIRHGRTGFLPRWHR